MVKLADVASVTRAVKEREIVSRIDGEGAVEVGIYKEGDANIVDVARRVRARVPALQKTLPEGVKLQVLSDQSTFIRAAIAQVRSNALIGGLLAVLVLFVFLRDVRATAIIALAIPASIVTTFVLMFRQGITPQRDEPGRARARGGDAGGQLDRGAGEHRAPPAALGPSRWPTRW